MSETIDSIIERIQRLQSSLDARMEEQRQKFRYQLKRGRVVFDAEIKRRHRELKTRLWPYLTNARLLTVVTAPVIYSLIIPLVLLDIFVFLYQNTCFPAYGIPRVKRRDYLVIDRHHLQYLNAMEKLNCVYCGYANGLLAMVSEVASRTEQYWCPIKHAQRLKGTHPRYPRFVEYGDAEHYHEQLQNLRAEIQTAKQ